MAVSRRTQRDIGNYEAKLIGPFTTRQIVFLAVGMVPAFFIDYILYTLSVDIYSIFAVTFLIMAVPGFFAFGSSLTYDMKPELFLKDYYLYHILAPKKRLYKTETLDDILEREENKKQKADKKQTKTPELKTFGKMKIYPHKPDETLKEFE